MSMVSQESRNSFGTVSQVLTWGRLADPTADFRAGFGCRRVCSGLGRVVSETVERLPSQGRGHGMANKASPVTQKPRFTSKQSDDEDVRTRLGRSPLSHPATE